MLGLFDSGLGGLTVLRRVRALLPQHDIIFFADQANVPYGDRTSEELLALLQRNIALLEERGAGAIVMACNTSCATAAQFGWPHSHVPILDLIDSAAMAVEKSGFKRIGIIATTATARAKAYTQKIRARVPDAEVCEVAAPALVPLVESGILEGPIARSAVEEVCARLPRTLDAVILACTHYPLLDAEFAAVLGDRIARIDPAVVQAERTADLVAEHHLAPGSGKIICITSGDPDRFRLSAAASNVEALTFQTI
ncbi:MAG TPA: glutamate racemase [Candidatus Rubrimentiphilum sp.]|nr:glutamate racemase [Candidatus Rubrimentiphilum sp.]